MDKKPPSCLGWVALWLLILLIILGGIKNAFSYRDNNFDISGISFPDNVLARDEVSGERNEGREEIRKTETIEEKDIIDELINFYSQKYEVDPYLVACLIQRESSKNTYAVGDKGKAVGLCQFHLGTWKSFRKRMGESQEDLRTDKAESIKTLAWALSEGYHSHWGAWKRGLCR